MITQLRGQGVAPWRVLLAKVFNQRLIPALLAETELLVDKAQDAIVVGAEFREPVEVIRDGDVVTTGIMTTKVGFDQSGQQGDRARPGVEGPMSLQSRLAVPPLGLE